MGVLFKIADRLVAHSGASYAPLAISDDGIRQTGQVVLSGFDPIRREVARMALERLIVDGRIHPARIEEVVNKCRKELDAQIKEVGEQACFDTGIHNVHPEIVRLLGRLKFRTSYGQKSSSRRRPAV